MQTPPAPPEPRARFGLVALLLFASALYLLVRSVQGLTAANAGDRRITVLLGGLGLAAACLMAGAVCAVLGRRRRLRDGRDWAVLAGEQTARPATEQPRRPAAAQALPLPLTVELRPRWTRIAAGTVALSVGVELAGGCAALLRGNSVADALTLPAAALLVFAPAFVLLLVNDARQTVQVGPHKLTVTGASRQSARTIHWHEARLFAVWGPGGPDDAPLGYELVGTTTRVRWVRIRRPMPFIPWALTAYMRPTLPYEEYDARMAAMLAFIAEQTKLPLSELR